MIWTWFGPADLPTGVMVTPPASMGDRVKLGHVAIFQQAMDGSYGGIRKPVEHHIHDWDFVFTRLKALEFKEFFRLYAGERIKIVDHNEDELIGYFEVNPMTYSAVGRGVLAGSVDKIEVPVTFKSVGHEIPKPAQEAIQDEQITPEDLLDEEDEDPLLP